MQELSSPIILIKKSFSIFFDKKNLVYFLKVYGILVPFAIFSLYQNNIINSNSLSSGISGVLTFFDSHSWFSWVAVLVNLMYVVFSFWVNVAGIKVVSGIVGGETISVIEILRFAWKKLWLFAVLSIVVGLLTGLGFILLIVPGVLFMVWFAFSGYELVLKEVGIKQAMGNSRNLVKGRFWRVFGRIVVFGIFQVLVQIVFGLIPLGLGSIILPLFGALLVLPYFLLYRELSVQ